MNNQPIDAAWPTATANKPTEVKDDTLKGVYLSKKKEEGHIDLFRAAIRPRGNSRWYTLGYFVCPHVAAYVFNVYALTMDMEYLVNENLQPNQEELQKWRDRKPENLAREQKAKAIHEAIKNGSYTPVRTVPTTGDSYSAASHGS